VSNFFSCASWLCFGQVTPPPGYDDANQPVPITLPPNAVPGQQLSVVLPELLPQATEVPENIPTAQVVPALNNDGWDVPPGLGDFDTVLTQGNNEVCVCVRIVLLRSMSLPACVQPHVLHTFVTQLEIRGCETITFGTHAAFVPQLLRGARCVRLIVAAIVVVVVLSIILSLSLTSGARCSDEEGIMTQGYECTYPRDFSGHVCWDATSWDQVVEFGFSTDWRALGWDRDKWACNEYDQTASDLYWPELSLSEQQAAENLGFNSTNWIAGGYVILD